MVHTVKNRTPVPPRMTSNYIAFAKAPREETGDNGKSYTNPPPPPPPSLWLGVRAIPYEMITQSHTRGDRRIAEKAEFQVSL